MKEKTTEALLLSRSIVLQQGLSALLESLPEITGVKAAKELTSAYAWIEGHPPGIIFLDIAMSGSDPRGTLEKIASLSPKTQRVLLVDHVQDVKWVPQYAEAILIKGAAPAAVAATVTHLLLSKGEAHEYPDSDQ